MEDALPGRVLVADDDPQVRELFVDFLDGQYEVEAVGSGEAALKVVSHAFDAVLLDRLMPGRSGGDVLAEIEARDLECPVAVVTSVEPEIDVVDMGFEDYLIKPVSRSNLLNTVDSLSPLGRLRRARRTVLPDGTAGQRPRIDLHGRPARGRRPIRGVTRKTVCAPGRG